MISTSRGAWSRTILLTVLVAGAGIRPASAAVTVPGNYGTIQAAINAVLNGSLPDGTTIDVQAGTYFETLSVGNTSKSLTVRGVGGANFTVVDAIGKGAAALNVFRATGRVVFIGLSFRRGAPPTAAGGGFVIQESSPSFVDCIFEQNSAIDGGGGALITSNATFSGGVIRNNSAARFGGGVLIVSGSRPVFTRTDILSNHSGTGGAGLGNTGAGGGVNAIDSSPTFRGSHINGNTSKFAAGGLFILGTYSSPYGRSMLVVEDTEVADNVSTKFSPGDNPPEGGGIHIEDNATATLIRTRILRNSAGTGGGLNSYRGRYDVFDSVIDSNASTVPTVGFGGGVAATSNNPTPPVRPGSTVNLTRTLVRNNSAPIAGGIAVFGDNYTSTRASMSLTSSAVSGNSSSSQGGGLLLDRTDSTITNSMIIANTVTGGAAPFGGGLLLSVSSATTISGTTIARNTAGVYGGGVAMDQGATIQMDGSQVYDNTAAVNGGGGIFVGPNLSPSGTIQNSTIADNSTASGNAYQIVEQLCPRTTLTYTNNTVTPKSGKSDIYLNGNGSCAGTATTIGQFNGSPSGRASGNNSNVPSFAKFLAVPATGVPSTLVWSVARATSVTISGFSPSGQATGTQDVAPSSTTAYNLTASPSGSSGPQTVEVGTAWGSAAYGDVPVPADYDGDGRSDIAVYRGSTGDWFIIRSSNSTLLQVNWGYPPAGDMPVIADYDGDGRADVAVYRTTTGEWFIIRSSNSTLLYVGWGSPASGDVPVVADYDGDGKADIAVYRQPTGQWFVIRSTNSTLLQVSWGAPALGDVPVVGDYDGDGKADVAVYRQSAGQWFIIRSSNSTLLQINWGSASLGDVPVVGDYDGDGRTDAAVARAATGEWWILKSSNGSALIHNLGFGDARASADFNGNGADEATIWRGGAGSWLSR